VDEDRPRRGIARESGEWIVGEQESIFLAAPERPQAQPAGPISPGDLLMGRVPVARRAPAAAHLFRDGRTQGDESELGHRTPPIGAWFARMSRRCPREERPGSCGEKRAPAGAARGGRARPARRSAFFAGSDLDPAGGSQTSCIQRYNQKTYLYALWVCPTLETLRARPHTIVTVLGGPLSIAGEPSTTVAPQCALRRASLPVEIASSLKRGP
jgi:hypothetical protein